MLQHYELRESSLVLLILAALALLPFGLTQSSQDSGLAAIYAFDGNAVDLSSNGNDAVIHGAMLVPGHDGKKGSAYALNGTKGYLVIPHSESLSLATQAAFSLWWKHEAQAKEDDYYTLFEKSDPERGGHSRYGMWLIGNHVEVCLESPDHSAQNCLDSANAMAPGWHHLAASYDGTTLRLYLDGKLSGEGSARLNLRASHRALTRFLSAPISTLPSRSTRAV